MHFSANTDSSMRICCNTSTGGRIFKNKSHERWFLEDITDPLEYFNSDQYNEIRLKMMNNQRPEMCDRCFNIEDAGGVSVRQSMIQVYPYEEIVKNIDHVTGKLTDLNVMSIDFSWGNKCNLKCKMCAPSSSDQLIEEFEEMGLIKDIKWHRNIKNRWEYQKHKDLLAKFAPNIKELLVTGGDPMVNNDYYDFLSYLVEQGYSKNILLKFHSNLAIMPRRFVEIWPHFKGIRPNISIDAIEDSYEYIRYPGKWNVVSNNIDELVELGKTMDVVVDVHTVFSTFNVHNIPSLIKYFSKYANDTKYISAFPYFIWVHDPVYANTQTLPVPVKDQIESACLDAINRYEEYFVDPWSEKKIELLKANLRLMKEQDLDTSKFYQFTEMQDALRPTKGSDIIPWYNKFKPV
jgi:uncharacterized radical SAM superfamily Fe-S cluster-containing enzyme